MPRLALSLLLHHRPCDASLVRLTPSLPPYLALLWGRRATPLWRGGGGLGRCDLTAAGVRRCDGARLIPGWRLGDARLGVVGSVGRCGSAGRASLRSAFTRSSGSHIEVKREIRIHFACPPQCLLWPMLSGAATFSSVLIFCLPGLSLLDPALAQAAVPVPFSSDHGIISRKCKSFFAKGRLLVRSVPFVRPIRRSGKPVTWTAPLASVLAKNHIKRLGDTRALLWDF